MMRVRHEISRQGAVAARQLVARADDGMLCIGSTTISRAVIIGVGAGAAGLVLIILLFCCLCKRDDDSHDAWRQHWMHSLRRRRRSGTSDDGDEEELADKPVHRHSDSDPYPEVPNYSGAYAPMIGAQHAAFSAVMAAAATGAQPGQPAAAAAPASYQSSKQANSTTRVDAAFPRQPQSVEPSQSGFTGAPGSRPGVSFANMSRSGVSARWRTGAPGSKFSARTGQSKGQGTIAPTVVDSNAGSSWHGAGSSVPGSRALGSLAYRPAAAASDGGSSYKGGQSNFASDIDISSAYAKSRGGTSAA